MEIITDRLELRRLVANDAQFILRLLNEPSFVQNIGDKGVRSLDDARAYILNGPAASYRQHGFGLALVIEKPSQKPAGICGLLKREQLNAPDLGYALVPEFWRLGYAAESASAVLSYAVNSLLLNRVLAVVNPDNERSIRLLENLGFNYETVIHLEPSAPEVKLFAFTK